jgi:hypothetical protein
MPKGVFKAQEKWSIIYNQHVGAWVIEDYQRHSRSHARHVCFLFMTDAILYLERMLKPVEDEREKRVGALTQRGGS